MTSTEQQSDLTRDEHLMDEAARFLLRLLEAIPKDQIDPKKYWSWAQKALRFGAEKGQTYEKMLSAAYNRLPMKDRAIPKKQSRALYSLGETLKSQKNFKRFRYLCKQYAPTIVVLARAEKEKKSQSMDAPDNIQFTPSEE